MDRFNPLLKHLKGIDTLRQISAVLSWDQETFMPDEAISARSDQLQTIAGLIHDYWQHDDIKNEITKWIDLSSGAINPSLTPSENAFIRELFPIWQRHTKLSKGLVQALTKTTTTAQHVWAKARQQNNFALFAPHLRDLIDLTREKIHQLGFIDHPYNTLIDEFEPGMTIQSIDTILNPLKKDTISFLQDRPHQKQPEMQGPFDYQNQLTYSNELMTAMGYDTKRGRLDVSTHPFTIDIHPTDVRITTRINTDNLMESISSTIHEVGHGLYEQGLDPEWAHTPYGAARSMGIHESQSRLWELFIGQSLAFWQGQLSRIHDLFPTTSHYSAQDLYDHCRHVRPHWCRVESDIVTYNLHIILRYECEKALFSNQLDVNDLPAFWNQKMHDYLGLDIQSDTHGCLQDVHWSAGLFGYFPSYTLGTLIASEIYNKLQNDIQNLDQHIKNQHFLPIKDWLNQHIHFKGSKLTTTNLLKDLGISYNPHQFLNTLFSS